MFAEPVRPAADRLSFGVAPHTNVLFIFGTRPEAIKLCPVLRHMRQRGEFSVKACVTAQHRGMLDQVLAAFQVMPDYDLDVMQRSEEHTSELQSLRHLVCRLLLEKKKNNRQ